MRTAGPNYIPGIDGLRAVAIFLVVAYHAFPALAPGGFVGVDVFFVISGFLITRLLVTALEEQKFSLVDFYVRRARRILPAFALVCVACLIAATILQLPNALTSFGQSLMAASVFASNVFFQNTSDYFSAPAHSKPLLHTWSLSVEEQAYIVWPLFLSVLWGRVAPRWVLAIVVALIVVSLAYSEAMVRRDDIYAFFIATSRAWELLIGAALALAMRGVRDLPGRLVSPLGILGLAAIGATAATINGETPFPGLTALPVCLGSAAVIAASHASSGIVSRVLSLAALQCLGKLSYSLYLWHWPILSFTHYVMERPPTAMEAAVMVALSLLLAQLTYTYVEQPFRYGRKGDTTSPRLPMLAPYAAVLTMLAAAGGALTLSRGLPSRLDESADLIWRQLISQHGRKSECDGVDNILRHDSECGFGIQNGKADFDFAVIGDSNGDHIVPIAERYAAESNLFGRQATRNSCSPLFGQTRKNVAERKAKRCRVFQERLLEFFDRHREIKTVILGVAWARYDATTLDNGLMLPGEPSPATAGDLTYYLDRTLRYFERRGIRVIVMGPLPAVLDLPINCVVGAVRAGKDGSSCRVAFNGLLTDPLALGRRLKTTVENYPGAKMILPSELLCDSGACKVALDRVLLFRDGEHLSIAGAELLYARLQPWPGVNKIEAR
jgi:peptidoglycan/LPS O-acetylase OafA/YrhL